MLTPFYASEKHFSEDCVKNIGGESRWMGGGGEGVGVGDVKRKVCI